MNTVKASNLTKGDVVFVDRTGTFATVDYIRRSVSPNGVRRVFIYFTEKEPSSWLVLEDRRIFVADIN